NIDFVNDSSTASAAKNVTVLVAGNGLTSADTVSGINVFEAGGNVQFAGTSIAAQNVTTVAADGSITVSDGTNSLVFQSDSLLPVELLGVNVNATSKIISLSVRGIVPAWTLNTNQERLIDSISNAPSGTVAKDLRTFIGSQSDPLRSINQALPALNSALFQISQRNVVRFNRSNYDRLRFLNDNRPKRYMDILLGQSDPCSSAGCSSGFNAWFEGFGDFLQQDDTALIQGYRANIGGFHLGLDKRISRSWIAGLGFSGSYADMKTNDRLQNGTLDQSLITAYGSFTTDDDWTFSASAGYSYNNYEIERNIVNFANLQSRHHANQWFTAFEVAKKLRFDSFDVQSYFAFDYIGIDENAYNEKTGGQLMSTVHDNQNDSYLQTIGVRLGRTVRLENGGIINPALNLGWVYDYGKGNVFTAARYTGGNTFTIIGNPVAKNRLRIGTSLDAKVRHNITIFGRYDGELSNNFTAHIGQAGINITF
ncbi:MAG: autotransporter outer membrane beta-barrel domain-containing protein, partial [Planctomycetaceae bacterium]|nr:autotransporter outer membrane beta-barrel domain-containing protein [Planctomycetaceae bacterium]